ncbi:MAG: magnesium/cobalt transporter CorA [Cyclobacteriaceae bacterium]|nr:magnesium/cobalt transporter CorA [Cyclobacteriaceae bacterium]
MKIKLNPLKMNPLRLTTLKRRRKKSEYSKKIGLPPGQILYVGDHDQEPVKINLVKYNEFEVIEQHIEEFDELDAYMDPGYTIWVNLDGINDTGLMQQVSEKFKFHPLMTEDIMNTEHLPKSEEHEDHLFFTLKMMRLDYENGDPGIISEHLSLVLGENFVISFQDKIKGDVFDNIRTRIHSPKSRIRKKKADYLFYALIDSVVDQYYGIMEFIRDRIEEMEDYVLTNPSQKYMDQIVAIKKHLTNIRRIVLPLKGAVDRIFADESEYITGDTFTYFRDVQDHIIHLADHFDAFREALTSLMDMYMSNLSNNLNVIMKTLTIFSLFFVPLTFIAGLYGMNFQHMPELTWKFGYPAVLFLMLVSVIIMFIFMRRRGWL